MDVEQHLRETTGISYNDQERITVATNCCNGEDRITAATPTTNCNKREVVCTLVIKC